MELSGRVALITGGAKRVGRAIAQRLARAGCHLAIHHRASADAARQTGIECQQAGVQVMLPSGDLADAQTPDLLVQQVLERFGRLDVLINNASMFEPMTLADFTMEAFEKTLRVNLTAPAALAHAARDVLRSTRGRIVNLCDAMSQRPGPGYLAYMASKAGLEALTKSLARALAPDVNVVGIAPGVVDWPEDYAPALREKLTARIPLGRAGTPEDVAAAVHFVLAEGDYLTGVILPIDGGRSTA